MKYIDQINEPEDLKKMNLSELESLAEEIRKGILHRDSLVGGHVGPNLGIVETTIALHYVFNSPKDKIVFDVSHQCYPHKILTGRKNGFCSDQLDMSISGYTTPEESAHDVFRVGHTSTSISLACGLVKARNLKGENHCVIALIGDGSLSGGEALEGLSNAAVLEGNFIIIVNDNEMSIAENHGGLYENLALLRQTKGKAEINLFKAMGLNYVYEENGNSVESMIKVLEKLKTSQKPTVLHIHTLKGKGYRFAEQNKEFWHWKLPFDVETGEISTSFPKTESYGDLTYQIIEQKINQGEKIAMVVAGTPGLFALTPERRQKLGEHYVDVGIAEEHAIAFCSGLAKGGVKPVFSVHSSFIQRTYDQLSQDLAANCSPAVILVYNNGISSMDLTHLGCFDIPLISNIPNIVYLSPASKEEYLTMLAAALKEKNNPVVIRVPSTLNTATYPVLDDFDCDIHSQVVHRGSRVAIMALGSFFELGEKVMHKLKEDAQIEATLINPRVITSLDQELLTALLKDHELVVTLEDGSLAGGWGEKIARFYGAKNMKVLNYGAFKEFVDRCPLEELYKKYRLTPNQIEEDVLKVLK